MASVFIAVTDVWVHALDVLFILTPTHIRVVLQRPSVGSHLHCQMCSVFVWVPQIRSIWVEPGCLDTTMIAISKQDTRVRWKSHTSRYEEVDETMDKPLLRKSVMSTFPDLALQVLEILGRTSQYLP